MKQVYFDSTATTPIHPEVLEVLVERSKTHWGNPSSVHSLGQKARVEIEQSRNSIANLLGVKNTEIFFTSGATEAINMIIDGVISTGNIDHVFVSPLEHHAVLHSLEQISDEITVHPIPITQNGELKLNELEALLQVHPKAFVIAMGVNNEIGIINPLDRIAALCQKYGAKFFSDMVQMVGKTGISLSNIDFASFSAHKFGGPKGIGVAYISSKQHIRPLLFGGGQEQNMRAGTENTASISAMAKAFHIALSHLDENLSHIKQLHDYLISHLTALFPNVVVYGIEGDKVPHIINFTIPGFNKMEMMHMIMDMNGICVSQGSACSSGVTHKSHVLEAIDSINEHSIRVSLSSDNQMDEIDYFMEVLKKMKDK
jgi:cysteine desulfurase